MSTRYVCVHCGHRFEHEEDGPPKRCSNCMRKGGLQTLGESNETPGRPAWLVPALVVAAVVALGAGYSMWADEATETPTGDAELRPLTAGELRGYLRAAQADGDELAELLVADEAVAAWAEETAGDASSGAAKVEALVAALRARASALAFVPWSLTTPRTTPLRTVGETLASIGEDGAREHLYPLEVAALTVAAARSLDVPAMVADAWAFDGDRMPPDPSGHFGYFVVAVYDDEPGQGEPTLHDPYGGHGTSPDANSFRVLTDPAAVGAAANLVSLHKVVHEGDGVRALEYVQKALALDARSPYARGVRAAVLISSGGVEEGVEELEAAAQIRPDGPRHNNLAGVYLAQRELERATREVARALEVSPDFANAHLTLAAIHLGRSEPDQALAELTVAERHDPDLMTLPMLWAQYFLGIGDPDEAARRAQMAVERRGLDWQTRLQAAQVFRAAGRYDEMRIEARRVMELAPDAQRGALRDHILQVLGSTALEEPLEDEDLDDEGDLDWGDEGDGGTDSLELGGGGDFQLGGGSSLLGGGSAGGDFQLGGGSLGGGSLGGGSLGGGSLGGGEAQDPLLMMGDPSKIRLGGGSGSGLELNLDE